MFNYFAVSNLQYFAISILQSLLRKMKHIVGLKCLCKLFLFACFVKQRKLMLHSRTLILERNTMKNVLNG